MDAPVTRQRRDGNDPAVQRARARQAEYSRRWREAHREEYLAGKKEFNVRHREERAAYSRAARERKLAERPPPRTEQDDKIILVNLLDMLKDMLQRA